mgnify:CR=1 FL=1
MKRKGFTLIELVVVMAIIAVLVLIIIAAIQGARRQSFNSQRVGNLQSVETALEARYARCGTYQTEAKSCEEEIDDTDFQAMVESLRKEGFLSEQMGGDLTRGYNIETFTDYTFDIHACNWTQTEEDNDCTEENSLYSAIR